MSGPRASRTSATTSRCRFRRPESADHRPRSRHLHAARRAARLSASTSIPNQSGRVLRIQADGASIEARQVNGHIVLPASALRAGDNRVDHRLRRGRRAAQPQRRFPLHDLRPGPRARSVPLLRSAGSEGAVDAGARRAGRLGDARPTAPRRRAPRATAGRASHSPKRSRSRRICSRSRPGSSPSSAPSATAAPIRMLHRETDAAKVARNRDAIFDLHAAALDVAASGTPAFPYPFGKFDFLLVPAFQFGGMEHPGAIFYNASGLLLDRVGDAERPARTRQRHLARDGAHVVRRSGDDAVVQRRVDEGGVRELHGGEDREPVVPGDQPRAAIPARLLPAPRTTSIARTAPTRSGSRSRT